MKVGFISTYFYPVLGGAETNCFYLAKELAKKHEVHVFTSHKGRLPEEETIENIHIHRSKTFFRFGYYAALYPSMLRKILKQDLDVLHVHSYGFLWHDFCILLKKIVSPKTKLVITPHGPFMALDNYAWWKKIYKAAVNVIEYLPNKLYDIVIEVNPSQRRWLPKYGFKKSKIIFLPNGIPPQIFSKNGKMKDLEKKFIISYVGRVQKYKGLEQVIQALPPLIKKNKNILFVIAGDPLEMNYLVEEAKKLDVGKHVLFLGRVPEEEKLKLLSTSKVFVFPSKWEAFGISMLEAMAKENVIVSTKTEGGLFLVEEEKNGYLFNYGKIDELKKILMKVIEDKKLAKISKNNSEKAKRFTWDKIAQGLEECYQQ